MKKILSYFLLITIILSSYNYNNVYSAVNDVYEGYSTNTEDGRKDYYIKDQQAPKIVYCYNHLKDQPPLLDSKEKLPQYIKLGYLQSNDSSTEPFKLKEEIAAVLYAGYPNDAFGFQEKYNLSDNEARHNTQLAIWRIIAEDTWFGDQVTDYWSELINYALNNKYYETISFSGNLTLKEREGCWKSDDILVEGNVDENIYFSQIPEGIKIINSNTQKEINNAVKVGDKFFLLYEGDVNQSTFKLSYKYKDTNIDFYKLISESAEKDYQNLIGLDTKEVVKEITINVDKPIEPKVETTSVSVKKVWEDNNSVDSRPKEVEVQLYKNKKAYGDIIKLNNENSWSYKWDKLDSKFEWSVDEVNVPRGYVKNVIKNDTDFIIKNKKIAGKLEITKTDVADGKLLANAGFRIYDENKNVVKEGRTNDNGIATFELGYGKYFYQEFEAPKGYVIDEKLYPFEIKNNGEIVKAQMKNEKIAGKLEITKTDVADGKLLANAGFRIYDENRNVIKEGRTNNNGIATFELGYGKYFYQEFEAPNGYIIDEKLYPFEIKNNGEIVKAQMKNEKIAGKLEITKADVADGKLLANAGFRIYDENKNVVKEGRTNDNGIATFELVYGKYFYQEFEAPNGYVIDEKLYPFEIKNNGEIVKAQMKNEKIAGKLEITKTDVADGKLLANAGFRIYDENKNVVKEGRTNDNGIATFELGYGKYFYQEFEAPNGYVIDEKLYLFEIKNNGEIVKAQMKNEKIAGKLEITKTDVADGKLLANAGFRIYDENRNVIKEGRTNNNGIATFELGYGKYFYQEFEAPNGYIIDEKLYLFEIKNNGEIVKVQMKNEKIVDSSEPSEPIDQGEPSEPIDQSELIESIESSESSIVIEAKNINEPIEQSKSNTPSYNDSSTSNTNTLPNTGGVNSRIYIAFAILIAIIGVRFLRSSKYRLDN